MRTRLPAEGVIPDSPASNGWAPGFMTDLMAKDLDLAIDYAAAAGIPLFTSGIVRQIRPVGAEWSLRRRLGFPGSPHELRAFADGFYGNDPAGTLLFWRG